MEFQQLYSAFFSQYNKAVCSLFFGALCIWTLKYTTKQTVFITFCQAHKISFLIKSKSMNYCHMFIQCLSVHINPA